MFRGTPCMFIGTKVLLLATHHSSDEIKAIGETFWLELNLPPLYPPFISPFQFSFNNKICWSGFQYIYKHHVDWVQVNILIDTLDFRRGGGGGNLYSFGPRLENLEQILCDLWFKGFLYNK